MPSCAVSLDAESDETIQDPVHCAGDVGMVWQSPPLGVQLHPSPVRDQRCSPRTGIVVLREAASRRCRGSHEG